MKKLILTLTGHTTQHDNQSLPRRLRAEFPRLVLHDQEYITNVWVSSVMTRQAISNDEIAVVVDESDDQPIPGFNFHF